MRIKLYDTAEEEGGLSLGTLVDSIELGSMDSPEPGTADEP